MLNFGKKLSMAFQTFITHNLVIEAHHAYPYTAYCVVAGVVCLVLLQGCIMQFLVK